MDKEQLLKALSEMSPEQLMELLSAKEENQKLRQENEELKRQSQEIDDLRKQVKDLQKEIDVLNKHLDAAKTFSDLFNEDREKKDAALQQALNEARAANKKADDLQNRLNNFEKGDIQKIYIMLANHRETIDNQNKVIDKLTNRIMDIEKQMTASATRNKLMSDKIDNLIAKNDNEHNHFIAALDGYRAFMHSAIGKESLENMLDKCEEVISTSIDAEKTDIYIVAPEKDDNDKNTGKFMLMSKDGIKISLLESDSMIAEAIQKDKAIIENNSKDIHNIGDDSSDLTNNILIMPQTLNEEAQIYAVAIAKNNPIGFDKRRADIAMGQGTDVHTLLEGAAAVKALEKVAYTNPVTGYANKAALNEFVADSVVKNSIAGKSTSIISLDIDFFKSFNDNYGHDTGDKALKHVLDTIKSQIRDTDIVCHPHGEEMNVILPNCPIEQASVIAERIRTAVEQSPLVVEMNGESKALDITVSSGVAELAPVENMNKAEIIQAFNKIAEIADERLNDGKNAGRNISVSNDDLSATALFQKYLKSFAYAIEHTDNGYSIIDVYEGKHDSVASNLDTDSVIKTIADLTEDGFLTDSEGNGLLNKLNEYAEEHRYGIPEIKTLQDVLSFASDVDRGFKPEYKEFIADNRNDINMLSVIASDKRIEKINFAEIAGTDTDFRQNNDIIYEHSESDKTDGFDPQKSDAVIAADYFNGCFETKEKQYDESLIQTMSINNNRSESEIKAIIAQHRNKPEKKTPDLSEH